MADGAMPELSAATAAEKDRERPLLLVHGVHIYIYIYIYIRCVYNDIWPLLSVTAQRLPPSGNNCCIIEINGQYQQ